MNTDELREALRRDAELAGRPPTDLLPRVAGLRRRSRRRLAGAVGCVLAVAVAVGGLTALDGARGGAGGQDGSSAAVAGIDLEAFAQEYRESIANAGAAGNRLVHPDLVEFLPNRQYRSAFTGGLFTLSDAVVVGHVTKVSPGHAHYWPADAEDRPPIEVPFDDPRAMSRTIHAEVAVTEVLAGQVREGTVVVGLGLGTQTPIEVASLGLPAMGELVLVLESDSPVYAHDAAVQYGIAEDGAALAEIGPDGRLTVPAIESYRVEQFLAATPTLDRLRAAAQEPTREASFAPLLD
jgi:hypothetical protein